jgi:hypothetical protein
MDTGDSPKHKKDTDAEMSDASKSSSAKEAKDPVKGKEFKCSLTRRELKEDGYKLADSCPNKQFGCDLQVSQHPAESAGADVMSPNKRKAHEQLVAENAKKACFSNDKLEEFIRKLLDIDVKEKELPASFEELKQRLESPVKVALPLPCRPAEFGSSFDYSPSAADGLQRLATIVLRFFDEAETGNPILGQNGLHLFLDEGWASLFKLFNEYCPVQLSQARDRTDNSTTGLKLRPDYLCYVKHCLLFRGEEEDSDFDKAREDLSSKLFWNPAVLGGINFVLAYAASTSQIELFAMNGIGRYSLTGPLNLTAKNTRARLLCLSVNIYRWFLTVLPRIPYGCPKLFSKLLLKDGTVSISFKGDKKVGLYVKKECPVPSNYSGEKGLASLYSKLQSHASAHVIRVVKAVVKKTTLTLHIQPVGCRVLHPQDEKELKLAIRGILLGIHHLHKLNYSHNDLRWDNILIHSGNVYFVCDLECATAIDSKPDKPLSRMAPELADGKSGFSVQSDLYLVGRLMDNSKLSDVGSNFQAWLCEKDPAKRPKDAERALSHEWFK